MPARADRAAAETRPGRVRRFGAPPRPALPRPPHPLSPPGQAVTKSRGTR